MDDKKEKMKQFRKRLAEEERQRKEDWLKRRNDFTPESRIKREQAEREEARRRADERKLKEAMDEMMGQAAIRKAQKRAAERAIQPVEPPKPEPEKPPIKFPAKTDKALKKVKPIKFKKK